MHERAAIICFFNPQKLVRDDDVVNLSSVDVCARLCGGFALYRYRIELQDRKKTNVWGPMDEDSVVRAPRKQ